MRRTLAKGDDRADEIYNYILEFKRTHDGHSPTYRQIQAGCEMSTDSLVAYYLKRLERDGLLELKERRILVVGGKWTLETE